MVLRSFYQSLPRLVMLFLVAFAMLVIGCGATVGQGQGHRSRPEQQPTRTPSTSSEPKSTSETGSGTGIGTELWIHGSLSAPNEVAALGATGSRGIVDLRKVNNSQQIIAQTSMYTDKSLGLCLTLRWSDPNGTLHHDVPPAPDEADAKLDLLMQFLTSASARAFNGRLWVQFYNELTGASKIDPKDADAMFDWATRAAERIRKEAPYIKICGPAVASLLLDKDRTSLKDHKQERYDLQRQIIAWTAKYADAADVHLHVNDAASARDKIKALRTHLDSEPNGKNVQIVAMEWSPARYQDRSDAAGVRQAILEIWSTIQSEGVAIAAYGSLYPAQHFGDAFGWQAIYKKKGQPNEPFYSTIKEIAAGNSLKK